MFYNYDGYNNRLDKWVYFSRSEWEGLIVAGKVSACVSFIANSFVLILHGFMMWYKPVIVNRLSLRMIVLSCIFNMLYCACQLVTDDISSTSFPCRVLAFVLIASDTMACMCLAMVGLNLVTIFVLKVSRSIKLELFYYFLICLSGVLVVVVPIFVGSPRGPKNPDVLASCWYHFFFDGRMTRIFNWMWYYGWLLFSLVFAAFCAAISIRFVMKRQDNFAGTLDMFTRRNDAERSQINTLKKYTNSNTDIFKKIAIRCICYPLVPLFSKSWGVGIEIAASQHAEIPYPIFTLDRIFSCLLGFMVSCIYFTDPAIGAVLKDSRDRINKKYVYDYYCLKYQPSANTKVPDKSQYPRLVKVISIDRSPPSLFRMRSMYSDNLPAESVFSHSESFISPLDMSEFHPHMSHIPTYHKPGMPTMEVYREESNKHDRRYSVVSVTTMNGKIILPNEVMTDHSTTDNSTCLCFKSKFSTIPMRRVNNTLKNSTGLRPHPQSYSKNTETVETLAPYNHPKTAKCIHWILVSIFKVSPIERRKSDEDAAQLFQRPSRVLRDYTDCSNPDTPEPPPSPPVQTTGHGLDLELIAMSTHPFKQFHRAGSEGSLHLEGSGSKSAHVQSSIKEFPIRKVSSINLATLFRRKFKKGFLDTTKQETMDSSDDTSPSTVSSGKSKLAKILSRGRSMSFNWNRLTQISKKSALSSSPSGPTSMTEMQDLSSDESVQSNTEEISVAGPCHPIASDPFPVQLSPRPTSRQRKKPQDPQDKSTFVQVPTKAPASDNPLLSLSHLFDGRNNFFDEGAFHGTADDILQPVTFTPTEDNSVSKKSTSSASGPNTKDPSPKKPASSILSLDEREGFIEGITTIEHIANWQDSGVTENTTRLNIYSEPWDIETQFKIQITLADNISHM